MRHPTLPPEQEIEVDEAAVFHHAGAGWMVVPAKELEARAAAARAAAEAELAAQKAAEEPVESETETPDPAPARRRATSKKAEE